MSERSIEIAKIALQGAMDKKAFRIVLMDLRGQSDVCDYQFICSAENEKQSVAIADAIEITCKASGIKALAIEGKKSGHWILLDFGSIMIHVFYNYLRDYYSLEQIYPAAKFIDLNTML